MHADRFVNSKDKSRIQLIDGELIFMARDGFQLKNFTQQITFQNMKFHSCTRTTIYSLGLKWYSVCLNDVANCCGSRVHKLGRLVEESHENSRV